MTGGAVAVDAVVVFRGVKRMKYDNCGVSYLMELSSKICAACGCYLMYICFGMETNSSAAISMLSKTRSKIEAYVRSNKILVCSVKLFVSLYDSFLV